MPQCKMSHCREPAVYGGAKWGNKRYCIEHGERYAARKQEYQAVQATLPFCETCGTNKITPTRLKEGVYVCGECEQRALAEAEAAEVQRNRAAHKRHIMEQLEACQTMEDMKVFIARFLLK